MELDLTELLIGLLVALAGLGLQVLRSWLRENYNLKMTQEDARQLMMAVDRAVEFGIKQAGGLVIGKDTAVATYAVDYIKKTSPDLVERVTSGDTDVIGYRVGAELGRRLRAQTMGNHDDF